MDVSQIMSLAIWYERNIPNVVSNYRQLVKVLENNANQPQKLPVREPLDALKKVLVDLPLDVLTNEEISKLDTLGALPFLGQKGAIFADNTVTSGEYDPASAAADMKNAHEQVNHLQQHFIEVKNALVQLQFDEAFESKFNELPIIRVRFQGDAAIADVQMWKKWATDWFIIARGAAMCVGQNPNDVRVVGASNGSIIFTLAATATVTLVLASIVKNVGSIVHEVLKISNAIEDLRHKRMLSEIIESELKRQQKELKESGVKRTVEAVKGEHPKLVQGEVENNLKTSVEKYLNFNNKGGDVDFLPPAESADDKVDAEEKPEEASDVEGLATELRQLREMVAEVRNQQAEIRLLTHNQDQTD